MSNYYDDHSRANNEARDLRREGEALEDLLVEMGMASTIGKNLPTTKEVIDTLPTFRITHEEYDKGASCAVCMEEFPLNSHPSRLPCFHLFHKACVVVWLTKHNSCPTCRYELATDDRHYNEEKTRERIENTSPPPSMFG